MEKTTLDIELVQNDFSYMLQRSDSFKEPLFTFTTRPRLGKVKCKMSMVYCRESFCEYLRQDLRKVTHNKIITTRLHMGVYRRVPMTKYFEKHKITFRNQVLAAQAMANAVEKHYGWPLTKVYPAVPTKEQSGVQEGNLFYYVNASKRWMKSPAMLSLFTLFFRIASHDGKFKFHTRIKDIDSFYDVLRSAASKSDYSEMYYVSTHSSLWPVVLDNYDKLFGKRTMKSLYQPDAGNYYFSEGINRLCDGDSNDNKLRVAFNKILKKERKHLMS